MMTITGGVAEGLVAVAVIVEFPVPDPPKFEAWEVAEEVTDVGRFEAPAWLNRAANCCCVTQVSEEAEPTQSLSVAWTSPKSPSFAWMMLA